ncbi:ABC transporter six-transmembrane domain-containing protein [Maritalea myrionectae]|uniref:ABC transporter six-transmembrane domain-containing protein n=1 Tax=Maritalea myrionectae TaxID=454601 RepID=UPI00040E9ACC|nr:ABC transporter six-transmembrane domain-containing protein [Maritalea myrionectae]
MTHIERVWRNGLSLRAVGAAYFPKVLITWTLLVLEALLTLLLPLCIGRSVDALNRQSFSGLIELGVLIVALIVIGSARRFYDTRAYSAIQRDLSNSLVAREKAKNLPMSKTVARVNLLGELVEFLEQSLPTLILTGIMFVGILVVVFGIDMRVMGLCFVTFILVVAIYWISGGAYLRLNKGQNDEYERQLDTLALQDVGKVDRHFRRLMRWRVRLSDLETVNFSLVWVVLAAMLLGSIYFIVDNSTISPGQKITTIMYVFDYIEVVVGLPIFYQEALRLKDITGRLSSH